MSIKKIFSIVLIILFFINFNKIVLNALEPIYDWLCNSLSYINRWDKNFQSILALIIVTVFFVLIIKLFSK